MGPTFEPPGSPLNTTSCASSNLKGKGNDKERSVQTRASGKRLESRQYVPKQREKMPKRQKIRARGRWAVWAIA